MEAIDNEQGIKSDSKNPIVYATFIERIGAFVLDFIIMLFPVGILFAYGYLEKSIFMLLLGSITMALYKPLMEGINGSTIGKKIIGIKMVDDKGEIIGLQKAFLKNMVYTVYCGISIFITLWLIKQEKYIESTDAIEIITLRNENPYLFISGVWEFVTMFSCMAMIYNSKKQTIHDKLADTYCIKEGSKNSFL